MGIALFRYYEMHVGLTVHDTYCFQSFATKEIGLILTHVI